MAHSKVHQEHSLLRQVRILQNEPPSSQGPCQFSLIHPKLAGIDRKLATGASYIIDDSKAKANLVKVARIILGGVIVLKTVGSFKASALKVVGGGLTFGAFLGLYKGQRISYSSNVQPLADRSAVFVEGQLMDLTSPITLATLAVLTLFSNNIGLTMLGFAGCQHALIKYGLAPQPDGSFTFTEKSLRDVFTKLNSTPGWQSKALSPKFMQGFINHVKNHPTSSVSNSMMRVFAAIPASTYIPRDRLIKAAIDRILDDGAVFDADDANTTADNQAFDAWNGQKKTALHEELCSALELDVIIRSNPILNLAGAAFDSFKYRSETRPTLLGFTVTSEPLKKENLHFTKLAAAVALIAARGLWQQKMDMTLWVVGPAFLYTVINPLSSGGIKRAPSTRLDSNEGICIATALLIASFVFKGGERMFITPTSGFLMGNFAAHMLPLYLENPEDLRSSIQTWTSYDLIHTARSMSIEDPLLVDLVLPALQKKLDTIGNKLAARNLAAFLSAQKTEPNGVDASADFSQMTLDKQLTELAKILNAITQNNHKSTIDSSIVDLFFGDNLEEEQLLALRESLETLIHSGYSYYPNRSERADDAAEAHLSSDATAIKKALTDPNFSGPLKERPELVPAVLRLLSKNYRWGNKIGYEDSTRKYAELARAIVKHKDSLSAEQANSLMSSITDRLKNYYYYKESYVVRNLLEILKQDKIETPIAVLDALSSLLSHERHAPTFSFNNKETLFPLLEKVSAENPLKPDDKKSLQNALYGLKWNLAWCSSNSSFKQFDSLGSYFDRFISIPEAFQIVSKASSYDFLLEFDHIVWEGDPPFSKLASVLETIDAATRALDASNSNELVPDETIKKAIDLLLDIDSANKVKTHSYNWY